MHGLKEVNLNQKNKDSIHRVYRNHTATKNLDLANDRAGREFYVMCSTTCHNKRLFTIRTQYCLVNNTGKTLQAKTFYMMQEKGWKDGKKTVKWLSDKILADGEPMALPDHDNEEI